MKRTVREDRGAWLLLKNAAVRAREIAKSLASTTAPKLPTEVVGAPGLRKSARMLPARSTTAITIGSDVEAAALCTTAWTSLCDNAVPVLAAPAAKGAVPVAAGGFPAPHS